MNHEERERHEGRTRGRKYLFRHDSFVLFASFVVKYKAWNDPRHKGTEKNKMRPFSYTLSVSLWFNQRQILVALDKNVRAPARGNFGYVKTSGSVREH